MATWLRKPAAGAELAPDDNNGPVIGLEQQFIAIPTSVLPRASITLDGTYPNALITAISTSAAGNILTGRKSENVMHHSWESIGDGSSIQKFRHMAVGFRVLDTSHEKLEDVQDLLNGAERYFVVTASRWKGTDGEDQFHFLGYDVGMVPVLSPYSSAENDGVMLIDFVTPDGEHETRIPRKYLNTDLSTTQGEFDAAFA